MQWQEPLRVWQWHGERACDLRYEVNTAAWKGPILELYDVVVTSYESFLQNQEMFLKESWTCVVLDEAQTIKNHATQTATAVKRLATAPFRLALTGTPIENSLDDIHSILEFVEPGCAGTLQDFRQRFPDSDEGRAALRKLLHLLTLRRESGEAVQLVAKEEVEVPVHMAPDQATIYKVLREKAGQQEISAHRCLREMELLCTHPWCYVQRLTGEDLTDDALNRRGASRGKVKVPDRFYAEAKDQDINDSGKLTEVFSLLRGIVARRDKVLVFFCRTATSELLAALMHREFGVRPGILRGDTPHAERERIVREFKSTPIPGEPQSQVLLLSVWVGAVGLNLPEARWVVHVERVWNPALERQATSRVHRLTSKFPVKAYCLYTQDTVEERKCAVLSFKHRLSTNVMEALDGELEESGEGEGQIKRTEAHGEELRSLICGTPAEGAASSAETCSGTTSVEDAAAMEEADPEESKEQSSDEEEEQQRDQPKGNQRPLYPVVDRLRPKHFKHRWVGKYGDPRDAELWDWYTVQGRREVHERAPSFTTAGLREQKPSTNPDRWRHSVTPFSSRPSRIRDAHERGDRIVTVALADGVSCRLFVPSHLWHFFTEDEQGFFARPSKEGEVAFPVLTPSSGRSAVDDEVGLLDITPGMVDQDQKPLDFLQIVAVKPSEVEKYRLSSPFFVVMELPNMVTVTHPTYGPQKPEDLGIGCSRHWLVRLAASLRMPYAFFLDDSVRSWRGVTLVEDPHCQFGVAASSRAQFTPVPFARVISYLAEPKFLEEDMAELTAFGFSRLAPELIYARKAFSRAQVYSGYLLNVKKVETEGLNFKQELFVWEDLVFNLQAYDIVRSSRFAMVKLPFNSGGCSAQIARSANPFIRAGTLNRMTGEQVVEETLGQASMETEGSGKRRKNKKPAKAKGPPEIHEQIDRPVPSDPFQLEEDPALKPAGAVVDEQGALVNSYYKRFIQAFKDAEKARADVAAPSHLKRPGVRQGEEIPDKLMFWDDSLTRKQGVTHSREQWGAGYIAKPFGSVKRSKWFNVKTWGCWRMAFVLARLQYQVWREKNPEESKPARKKSTADKPPRSGQRSQAPPAAGRGDRKKGKNQPDPSLHKFFATRPEEKDKKQERVRPKQKSLLGWMGASEETPPGKRQRQDTQRHPVTP